MDEQQVRAILLLSGIKLWSLTATANGYSSSRMDPWWEAHTEHGTIVLGWRKRVINIDWTATGIHCVVTRDNVTKELNMVHAYSHGDAVKYLADLHFQAKLPEDRRNTNLENSG